MNSFRGEFETYDSRDDERGGGDAQSGGGFTERDYADRYAAYRADARPDGVGRSHRNRFHGDSQKPHTQRHAYGAYNIRKRISEAVRHFEHRRPDNFKKAPQQSISASSSQNALYSPSSVIRTHWASATLSRRYGLSLKCRNVRPTKLACSSVIFSFELNKKYYSKYAA